MSAATDGSRGWITIGEVLSLVIRDFPDMSISKIRFLETEGLISPQRAKSGYRRFTDDDVDQLRLVLIAQRDRYLPLRVIKEHLAAGNLRDVVHPQPVVEVQQVSVDAAQPGLPFPAAIADQRPEPRTSQVEPGELLSLDTVVARSGLTKDQLDDLLGAGVLTSDPSGRLSGADLEVCRAYAVLLGFGVDHRHMRQAKNAASRESSLIGNAVGHLSGEERADNVNRLLDALSEAHYWLVVSDLNRQTPTGAARTRPRTR